MGSITAAAVPAAFIVDGEEKEFWLSPLTDKEIDEVDMWLQTRYIDIARRSLENCSAAERTETLAIAMQEANSISMLNAQGIAILATITGMTEVAFVSLRKRQPNILKEDVRKWLGINENLMRLNSAFSKANDVGAIHEKNGKSKKKSRV